MYSRRDVITTILQKYVVFPDIEIKTSNTIQYPRNHMTCIGCNTSGVVIACNKIYKHTQVDEICPMCLENCEEYSPVVSGLLFVLECRSKNSMREFVLYKCRCTENSNKIHYKCYNNYLSSNPQIIIFNSQLIKENIDKINKKELLNYTSYELYLERKNIPKNFVLRINGLNIDDIFYIVKNIIIKLFCNHYSLNCIYEMCQYCNKPFPIYFKINTKICEQYNIPSKNLYGCSNITCIYNTIINYLKQFPVLMNKFTILNCKKWNELLERANITQSLNLYEKYRDLYDKKIDLEKKRDSLMIKIFKNKMEYLLYIHYNSHTKFDIEYMEKKIPNFDLEELEYESNLKKYQDLVSEIILEERNPISYLDIINESINLVKNIDIELKNIGILMSETLDVIISASTKFQEYIIRLYNLDESIIGLKKLKDYIDYID